MAKYLKLGEGRNVFHSMGTNLTISNKMVVRVKDTAGEHRDISEGLRTGHLSWATEQEWKAYQDSAAGNIASVVEPTEKTKDKPKGKSKAKEFIVVPEKDDEEDEDDDEDDDLSKTEMIDALKASDEVKEDMKKSLTKMPDADLKELYNKIFKK